MVQDIETLVPAPLCLIKKNKKKSSLITKDKIHGSGEKRARQKEKNLLVRPITRDIFGELDMK
jgi:hypothetical protein